MIWIFLWYDATWYSDFDKTSLLKVADFRTRVSRCCFLARFMSHGKFTTRQHNLSCAEKLRYPSWYIPTTIALVVQRVPSSDVGDRCNAVAQPPRASWKHQWNRKLTSFVQQIFCHLLCGEVCMCNKKYISYMLCRLSMIVSYCWYTLIYIYTIGPCLKRLGTLHFWSSRHVTQSSPSWHDIPYNAAMLIPIQIQRWRYPVQSLFYADAKFKNPLPVEEGPNLSFGKTRPTVKVSE